MKNLPLLASLLAPLAACGSGARGTFLDVGADDGGPGVFIGDGLTGTGSGAVQQFTVPERPPG